MSSASLEAGVESRPLMTKMIKVQTVKGPWLSLGIHVDFQRPHVDLHILWWIITIGRDYENNCHVPK